jgi:hypothetical protein
MSAGREWRSRAACVGTSPDLFFPTAESGVVYRAQVAAAKAVCSRCVVTAECLTFALERMPYGIAGGLTAEERRARRTGRATERVTPAPSDGGRRISPRGSRCSRPDARYGT